ncbi:MAG: rhodanese-like domain-containing protein [Rickettsiaceae bacterium]
MGDHNRISILSFYSFINIPDYELLMPKILLIGKKKLVKGTVILANEGVNGSIAGTDENVKLVFDKILELVNPKNVNVKTNYSSRQPFDKLKVKLKPEIISMNVGYIDINSMHGKYIDPEDWDNFIQMDDVVTIDTRNHYEVEIGTFKNAVDPNIENFKQFPDWVENNRTTLDGKKIAMFCTGGIRCEKSTSYLKSIGYEDVYHLKGGILQYLEDTKNHSGNWNGECFVFDNRIAVDNHLFPSIKH